MAQKFDITAFLTTILKGLSQIMLQENSLTGLLFLAGIFSGQLLYGIAAIVATLCGTLTAMAGHFKREETQAGLYGFSPALVGVALTIFFQATWLTWLFIIIGSVLAALLQHFFIQKKIPAYTFPFILVTWILYYLIHSFQLIPSSLPGTTVSVIPMNFLLEGLRGFGQVIFQGGVIAGFLFFIAVGISSPIAALFGLLASFAGALIARGMGLPTEAIQMGVFGFNAVLSAIAFSGPAKSNGLWVLNAVLLTVFIHIGLLYIPFLMQVGGVLTFPFVAGTWLTLLIQKIVVPSSLKTS